MIFENILLFLSENTLTVHHINLVESTGHYIASTFQCNITVKSYSVYNKNKYLIKCTNFNILFSLFSRGDILFMFCYQNVFQNV